MSGGGNFSFALNPGNQQMQQPRRGVIGKILLSALLSKSNILQIFAYRNTINFSKFDLTSRYG